MKQNKLYSWLTSLLVMVMLALVGQTAMAQDATFNLVDQDTNQLTSGDVQVTFKNYLQGANIWNASSDMYSVKVNGLNGVQISKIEFEIYQMGYAYDTVVEKNGRGTFTYNHSGTSTWTGSSSEVQFVGTSSGTDVYVTELRVWTGTGGEEPTPSDFPKTGVAYQIQEISSSLYLNVFEIDGVKDVVLNTTPQALYFTTSGTGYIITTASNGAGLYVGGHNEKDWNMSSKVSQTWNVIPVTGGYALQRADATTKYIGFDNTTSGSAAFRDKGQSARAIFNIEEIDMSDKTYTVNVTGNPSAATVTVKGVDAVGGTVTVAGSATQADVVATDIAGYEYTVSISGDVITVTYSKLPEYIEFVPGNPTTKDGVKYDRNYVGCNSGNNCNLYGSGWGKLSLTSPDRKIVKVEMTAEKESYTTASAGTLGATIYETFDKGQMFSNGDDATWTGSENSLEFTSSDDIDINKVRVYLEDLTPKTYTVSISGNPSEAKLKYDGNEYANGSTFTATLSESDLSATEIAGYNYEITIDGTTINVVYSEKPSMKIDYVTVDWGTDHLESGAELEKIESVQVYMQDNFDYFDGVPTGMTFTDGSGNEQTITYCYLQGSYDSNWNYLYNSFYFGFNETITTPGTYTLHIPAGAIKNSTTGLENAEINFQFVIPTPVEFAAPTLTPTEGTVESLKEFTLTAPAGVTFNTERSLGTITVNGNTEHIYDYEYAEDGSSLTFSLSGEYTTDGQAVVVLPQGFVRSTTNEYSPEITATYTVAYPWYEIHSYSALEPADGLEVKELSTITISAPTDITFDCTSAGEERNITVSLNGKDEVVSANVYADRIVLNYATKAVGSYEFVIAANAIPANSGKKGNKAVSFSYSIAPTLSVSNVGWTTFCYDKPFTLADGYTPYMIQTAEDGVAEPVEILGAPKTETIKGYTCYNVNDFDNRATMSGGYITGSNLENKVEVTCGGNINYAGSGQSQDDELDGVFYEVSEGAWIEIKGVNGTQVVSVEALNWNPYEAEAYNYKATSIEDGIRIEFSGNCWFGGLDVNIAIPGEYEKPIIPAGTGILVQGTPAQDVAYQVAYGATSDVTGNILTGCVADKTVTDTNKLFYKFSLNASRDAGSEGFYWDSADGHSINMHGGKAYLILDATSSIRGFRLFGEETESISNVQARSENAPAFNLQGQRVNKNNFRSGLYIQNGKKILVK